MFLVFVFNELGVFVCVIGLFLGWGYNIESFIVLEIEYEVYLLCIIIVMCGMLYVLE